MECVENVRIFKPYITKLISHLCVHCRLDEDVNKDTVPGEKEEFGQFRKTVKEVLRDVIFIVGSLEVFGELYSNICKPNLSWNENEACLFVMHAVAPSIRTDESKLLQIAVPVLLSIPPDTHCAVRATTLDLIGELAEWIDNHHDVLDTVLQFILDGLKIQSVASHAAKAVQKVCQKCRKRMAPHFDGLLQIIQSADQLSVSNDAIVGLLKGAAEVLSQLPHDKVTAGMRGLVQLHITPLLELTQNSHLGKAGTSGDPALWMDRLTALFRSCSIELDGGQSHPCQPVVEELWPVIAAVVTTYQSDDKIMERTCRCVRFILRCLGKYSYSILTSLVEIAIQVYKSHHQSCFLYLGSIIVDEFGSDPNYQQGLLFMLVAFAEVSFPLLSGPTGLIDNPDTIDDIFRLCSRFIQHVPEKFLGSPVAPASIQCALAASVLDHRDAFSSVMKFFRDLLTLGKNDDLIEADKMQRQAVVSSFIAEHGPTIMDRKFSKSISLVVRIISFSPPLSLSPIRPGARICNPANVHVD
ncbi:Transportin-3 [Geodia barretti]|uniref:Transportin-3 n=1 Tax=Geodia barretti TaxID=519541 RepID=A0AA35S5R1_GEOBA|nr:Transportin-3 [Geodia barretti]